MSNRTDSRSPWRLAFVPCLVFLCLGQALASGKAASEYDVKAAFVYNFAKFVRWPPAVAEARDDRVVLCVIGNAEVQAAFAAIEGRSVGARAVAVRNQPADAPLEGCHVWFLAATMGTGWPGDLSARSAASHTLTVSDKADFARRGGMIQFVTIGQKVRFEIDNSKAEAAELELSSRLLQLAVSVYTDTGGGQR